MKDDLEKMISDVKYFSPRIRYAIPKHPIYCRFCMERIKDNMPYVYWDERSKRMIEKLGFTQQTRIRFVLCIECFRLYKEDLIKLYSEGWIVINEKELEEVEDAE